jgi:hypothetical protein
MIDTDCSGATAALILSITGDGDEDGSRRLG